MNLQSSTMNTTNDAIEPDVNYAMGMARDILAGIAFLTTMTVSLLVRSYLNSVSLAKQCLLLYLYKEVGTAISWMRFFWVIEVVLSNWVGFETKHWEAIVISFGIWCWAWYLSLILNIICFLKLYMTRTKLLDPPLPLMGKDDETAIIRIRISCCIIVILFLGVCFSCGLYPKVYYSSIGQELNLTAQQDLSTSNLLYRGISGVLLISFFVTSLAVKLHKTSNEPPIDSAIPRTVNFIVGAIFVSVVLLQLAEILQFLDFVTLWKGYQILMSTIHIIVPPVVVLKSKQLKSHSARFFSNRYDDLLLFNVYCVPVGISVLMYASLYTIYQAFDI